MSSGPHPYVMTMHGSISDFGQRWQCTPKVENTPANSRRGDDHIHSEHIFGEGRLNIKYTHFEQFTAGASNADLAGDFQSRQSKQKEKGGPRTGEKPHRGGSWFTC